MPHPYACSVCGVEVKVSKAGEISRPCDHHDAAVIAERTSILYGEGGATSMSLIERAEAAIKRLAQALRGA